MRFPSCRQTGELTAGITNAIGPGQDSRSRNQVTRPITEASLTSVRHSREPFTVSPLPHAHEAHGARTKHGLSFLNVKNGAATEMYYQLMESLWRGCSLLIKYRQNIRKLELPKCVPGSCAWTFILQKVTTVVAHPPQLHDVPLTQWFILIVTRFIPCFCCSSIL